jgi:threonine dehydrogenase-like Zn-dependent dehydrogenase
VKALRVEHGAVRLADVPRPDAGGEALVRVLMSGICGTDLEIARGYAGFSGTIGHEFVGVVEKAAGRSDMIGKRVVGEINAGCGKCELCITGDPRHCPGRTVLGIVGRDGAHAEFLTLPEENLVEVPENVSDRQAVFAEPLAAAVGITELVKISPADRIALIGDGKLGLLCAMALRQVSENIVLIGRHREKLAIGREAGVEGILESEISRLGRRFDVVVEAAARNPALRPLSVWSARAGGSC